MGGSVNQICRYHKVFLYPQEEYLNLPAPAGMLEISTEGTSMKIEGEIFNREHAENKELGLKLENLDGSEAMLGKFRKAKGGQGKIIFKTRVPVQLENSYRVLLCSKDNKANWCPLLFGVLNCPIEQVKAKPGSYLWNSATQDFPLLLEKVMEKVESITEKVTTLETRRAQITRQPLTIRRVEPFRPPLSNYKWWRLG